MMRSVFGNSACDFDLYIIFSMYFFFHNRGVHVFPNKINSEVTRKKMYIKYNKQGVLTKNVFLYIFLPYHSKNKEIQRKHCVASIYFFISIQNYSPQQKFLIFINASQFFLINFQQLSVLSFPFFSSYFIIFYFHFHACTQLYVLQKRPCVDNAFPIATPFRRHQLKWSITLLRFRK